MTMSTLSYGMNPVGNVCTALTFLMNFGDRDLVAVVRSIDSSRSTEEIARILTFHQVDHKVVSSNVCLSMDDLEKALNVDVFTGFDEVWLLSGMAPSFALGQVPYATSDGSDWSIAIPEEVPEAMERTGCILIVGDGCGLNFATPNDQIRNAVLSQNQSKEQPHP
jgi:hypothetical protein